MWIIGEIGCALTILEVLSYDERGLYKSRPETMNLDSRKYICDMFKRVKFKHRYQSIKDFILECEAGPNSPDAVIRSYSGVSTYIVVRLTYTFTDSLITFSEFEIVAKSLEHQVIFMNNHFLSVVQHIIGNSRR